MNTNTKRIGRIERAFNTIKELEQRTFSEKDLRGLSKVEKEFIIENDYKVVYNQRGQHKAEKVYLFISRNHLGKKQLYAITKKQSINPNGHDIVAGAFNYECWLSFQAEYNRFDIYRFERHFCKTPNVTMIFA